MFQIAVIGCGNRSYLAFQALEYPNTQIIASTDPDSGKLEKFDAHRALHYPQAPPIRPYADYRELLEKERPDAIFITSPDHFHEEQATACLKKGIAVYLEKPLSIGIESCDRILRTAKELKSKFMIGHNMRYMWFTNKMKEIIDSGAIGDVSAIWVRHFVSYGDGYFFKWYGEQENINSLLLQKGAHDIDIIHMLAGAYTERVSGYGKLSVYDKRPKRGENDPEFPYRARKKNWPPEDMHGYNPKLNINDHNMIQMQLANGVQASYMQCFYTPDSCRNYTIIGTRGRIENYGDMGGNCQIQVWNRRVDTFRLEGDITYREPPQDGSGHGGADAGIVSGFIGYVLENKQLPFRPQDARYAAICGICGADSIRQGNIPVEIPKLTEDLEYHVF